MGVAAILSTRGSKPKGSWDGLRRAQGQQVYRYAPQQRGPSRERRHVRHAHPALRRWVDPLRAEPGKLIRRQQMPGYFGGNREANTEPATIAASPATALAPMRSPSKAAPKRTAKAGER